MPVEEKQPGPEKTIPKEAIAESPVDRKEKTGLKFHEMTRQALIGVDGMTNEAEKSIHDQTKSLEGSLPVESRSELQLLLQQSEKQMRLAASEARIKLTSLEKSGGLTMIPEPGEIETSVGSGRGSIDKVWAKRASAAGRQQEPISLEEDVETEKMTEKSLEAAEQKFDHVEQYSGLRDDLKTTLDAETANLFETYAPKTLKQILSSEKHRTRLAGALLERFSHVLKSEGSQKNPEAKAALETWKKLKKELFEKLKKQFDALKNFNTSNPALAHDRMLEMCTQASNRLGDHTHTGSLLIELLQEAVAELKSGATQEKPKPPEPIAIPKKVSSAPERRNQIALQELEKQQDWLDTDREEAFANVSKFFHELDTTGDQTNIREWFVATFNVATLQKEKPLTLADVQSLTMIDLISISASRVAGKEIRRPVLLFEDPEEMKIFVLSLGLPRLEQDHVTGMQVPGNVFVESSIFHKTGLLISTANKDYIGHEIRHSIDPNIFRRTGVNRAIDEAFAYFNYKIGSELKNDKKVPDNSWKEYLDILNSSQYEDQYFFDVEKESVPKNWKEDVKKMVDAIKIITKERGHIETQRLLAKSETITDILQVAGLM